jgi:hypothetical protein
VQLRYQFEKGETVRWKVEHRARVRTSISGTTQTAETDSTSVKVWRVTQVDSQGVATFEHSVERIQMRQQVTGRQAEVYDSDKDKDPPAPFQSVAKSVGVTLTVVRLDPRGKVIQRKDLASQALAGDSQITLPLPEDPVAVGEQWSIPHEIEVSLDNGGTRKIQTRQQFKLEAVKHNVATISVQTVVLTPVRDPAIEAQLIQRQSAGTVSFDLEAGRVLSQQMDLDKQVIGFRGQASSLHYQTRFSETLLPRDTALTRKPAGPELPKK